MLLILDPPQLNLPSALSTRHVWCPPPRGFRGGAVCNYLPPGPLQASLPPPPPPPVPAEALLAKVDSCPPALVWESVAARPLPGGGVGAGGNPASNGGTAELFSGLYQESHEFVLSFGGKDAYVIVIFIIRDFDDLLVVALSVFSLMVSAVSWPACHESCPLKSRPGRETPRWDQRTTWLRLVQRKPGGYLEPNPDSQILPPLPFPTVHVAT